MKWSSVIVKPVVVSVLSFGIGLLLSYYLKDEVLGYVINHHTMGSVVFVMLAALAVVFPSFTNMMFIPLGTAVFGPFWAAVLCILGWWIGSVGSFAIGRHYSELLLTKFPSFKNYLYIDRMISSGNVFWKLILLRMTFPVDVLSYGLALFSKQVTHKMNAATTLIGITPFAFIFTYGSDSLYRNVVWLTTTLAVTLLVYLMININNK